MTDGKEEEPQETLARHKPGRSGLLVKLDQGFQPGVYGICVDYRALSGQIGFAAARRVAMGYASSLHGKLAGMAGHEVDEIDDEARHYLYFAVTSEDGRWHDAGMKQRFRSALLRVDQEQEQDEAGVKERRRSDRGERFRQHLERLLEGEAYRQMDAVTKERLLADVTAMAFPHKGREL